MNAKELTTYLSSLIKNKLSLSVMIWGAPGIGKSSIVSQVAGAHKLELIDLRLSQLAPTDLRGLPVPKDGLSTWYPPEFLPTSGRGILFLDEINMAPPAMQGMAQQLILDRKVGSYTVPEGWYVWAAGNRKQDRASVFDMPAPLANRFLHLHIEPDNELFRQYAYKNALHTDIIAFLAFRQSLTHCVDENSEAWPSPRTWEMANQLLQAGLDIEPAVGTGAADEFQAFVQVTQDVPDLKSIVAGELEQDFPTEASLRYATVVGLVAHIGNVDQALNAMLWLVKKAEAEWVQLFINDLFPKIKEEDLMDDLKFEILQHPELRGFLQDYVKLLT
jgi:MoxR-like ATPase